jgi:hypothetical protein
VVTSEINTMCIFSKPWKAHSVAKAKVKNHKAMITIIILTSPGCLLKIANTTNNKYNAPAIRNLKEIMLVTKFEASALNLAISLVPKIESPKSIKLNIYRTMAWTKENLPNLSAPKRRARYTYKKTLITPLTALAEAIHIKF